MLGAGRAEAAFPERQITLICGSGAGGIVDVTARLMAEHMSRTLGRPVIVQNEPSAGTTVAIKMVSRATPDGYTLLFIGPAIGVVQELYPKAGIDVVNDLTPVSLTGATPQVLLVDKSVPGKDYASIISYLKSHPGEATTGSNGRGSAGHLAIELFKKEAGVDVRYIPYKTTPQVHTDLIAGRLSMMMTSSIGDISKYTNIRAVAVTSLDRWAAFPDVPTLAELGLKDFEAVTPTALLAPKGTPPDIIATLNGAIGKAVADPALRARLNEIGIVPPRATGPEAATRFIGREVTKWTDILRASEDQTAH
jgi:tripartite-type tricarboxylate transporter receptor subunit TctC